MIMLSRLKSPAKLQVFYWREKIVHMTEAGPAKKHVFCSRDGCRDVLQNSCLCAVSQGVEASALQLTARRFN